MIPQVENSMSHSQNKGPTKILYKITFKFMYTGYIWNINELCIHSWVHPQDISLCMYKYSKVQKTLKSQLVLVLSILDKGYLYFILLVLDVH